MRDDRLDHREHVGLRFADRKPADGVSVKAHGDQRPGAFDPERRLDAALHDAEQGPARLLAKGRLGPLRPAQRQAHGALRLLCRARQLHAFVELHLDVGAEQALDFHRALRGQFVARPVDMRLEGRALFADLPQLGEAHHLKAARVGQDRMGPVHEPVQPAERVDPLGPGRKHQVIGVGKHDVGAGRAHVLWPHRLDRCGRSDRHEGRRADGAARRRDRAEPGRAVHGQDSKAESRSHRGS